MEAFLIYRKNCVAARCAMAAGSGKRTGINEQCFANEVIYCKMGVAVDNAICCGKEIPHTLFNIMPCPGPVTEADTIAINCDHLLCGECPAGRELAHVSVYRMNLLVVEDIKDGDIGQVTCMEDNGTVLKCLTGLLNKPRRRAAYMGV